MMLKVKEKHWYSLEPHNNCPVVCSDNRKQASVFARVRNRVCPAGTHRVGHHLTSGQTPLSPQITPQVQLPPGERSGTLRDHRGGAGIPGHHSAVTIPACATIVGRTIPVSHPSGYWRCRLTDPLSLFIPMSSRNSVKLSIDPIPAMIFAKYFNGK